MKPNEFVKKYGLDLVKRDVACLESGFITKADFMEHYGFEILDDLKRLVKSHGLADRLGGVETMLIMIEQMEINDLCDGMNISFDGEWQGVFTKDQLQQAIADVEACQ